MAFSHLIKDKTFYHDFQPIIDLDYHQTIGYEALFRSGAYATPESAYDQAMKSNQLYELDISSIDKAVHSFVHIQDAMTHKKLFVNAYPSTILHPQFATHMDALLNLAREKERPVVLEIIESEEINDFSKLAEVVRALKQEGLQIAVDDFGKGGDNINRTIEVDADYIKLDRYFSINLTCSQKKQAYVSFIAEYCAKFNINLNYS